MTGSGERTNRGRAYAWGIAVALLTCFLTVWTTIVRDDGNGIGFFMLILAMAVGWAAAGFRPAGMARTMLGVAIMQVLLAIAIVTAPITANVPGAISNILRFSGIFTVLWLVSAAFFRAAAKADRKAALAM